LHYIPRSFTELQTSFIIHYTLYIIIHYTNEIPHSNCAGIYRSPEDRSFNNTVHGFSGSTIYLKEGDSKQRVSVERWLAGYNL
jgi:hypothetical protein